MDVAEQPVAEYHTDFYRFTWAGAGVEIELSRFSESGDTLTAEATAASRHGDDVMLLKRSRVNLLTDGGARLAFQKALQARAQAIPWPTLLEQAFFLAVERFREGEPAIDLADVEPGGQRWLLHPYIEIDGATVMFGPGGTGKSMLAVALAFQVATGEGILGSLRAEAHPVLYLDWEANEHIHAGRTRAVAHALGHDESTRGLLYYRQMTSPLSAAVPWLRRFIAQRAIGLIVVDSMTPARGSSEHATYESASMRLYDALRSLGIAALVIDHVSKGAIQAARGSGEAVLPYGSIMSLNRARNAWLVTQGALEGQAACYCLSLEHVKTNNGLYEPRRAYRVEHTNDAEGRLIAVDYSSTSFTGAFPGKMTLAERILELLRGGAMSAADIGQDLGVAPANIRTEAANLVARRKLVRLGDPKNRRYGLAEEPSA